MKMWFGRILQKNIHLNCKIINFLISNHNFCNFFIKLALIFWNFCLWQMYYTMITSLSCKFPNPLEILVTNRLKNSYQFFHLWSISGIIRVISYCRVIRETKMIHFDHFPHIFAPKMVVLGRALKATRGHVS